jgi:hypothetical protein
MREIEDSSRSLSSTLKRAKEAVEKFGDPRKKSTVLRQLNDVDYRLPSLGSAAVDTVGRIENLFADMAVVEISDSVKLLFSSTVTTCWFSMLLCALCAIRRKPRM